MNDITTQKTFYKLVQKSRKYSENGIDYNDILRSYNSYIPNILACEYELNKTTTPKIGKLFVFKSLIDVKIFLHDHTNINLIDTVLLKVIGMNPTYPGLIVSTFSLCESNIELCWTMKNYNDDNIYQTRTLAPSGTILVDSITPIEILPLLESLDRI